MEFRKWEELPTDCLVDILERVGMESLLLDIPFVCKSWYQASLSPHCWKQLDFSFLSVPDECKSLSSRFERRYGFGIICNMKFVKGVVDRSGGCVTYVKLPSWYRLEEYYDGHCNRVEVTSIVEAEEISFFADNCPALKTLVFHSFSSSTMSDLSSVIGKFKDLEMLSILGRGSLSKDIVTQIGAHCPKFKSLSLVLDVSDDYDYESIGEDVVKTNESCLPKLQALTLNCVMIDRANLLKLLNGCAALVHLDVSNCYGFDEDDEQVVKLSSHIPTFISSGSIEYSSGYDEFDDYYDYDDVI